MAPDEGAALKLRAEDAEDLAVISACLQDALVAVRDLAYDPEERSFPVRRQPISLGKRAAARRPARLAYRADLVRGRLQRGGGGILSRLPPQRGRPDTVPAGDPARRDGASPSSNFPAAQRSGSRSRESSATPGISASRGRRHGSPRHELDDSCVTVEPVCGDRLIMALPNGRILGEVMPLLRRIGIEPEPAFDDPASRQLRFATSEPGLDLIRVRSFDVATFVAFGAAQLGVAGNDVLMEFDYSEIYAPLDLDVGHCRMAVAAPADWAGTRTSGAGAICASRPNIRRSPAAISRRAASRPNASSSTARSSWRRCLGSAGTSSIWCRPAPPSRPMGWSRSSISPRSARG